MTDLGTHIAFLALTAFATALVTAAIRLRSHRAILRETIRFFLTITIGITLFAGVVYVVEWIFIRPLL